MKQILYYLLLLLRIQSNIKNNQDQFLTYIYIWFIIISPLYMKLFSEHCNNDIRSITNFIFENIYTLYSVFVRKWLF